MNAGYPHPPFQLAPLNTKDALERIGDLELYKDVASTLSDSVGESLTKIRGHMDAQNLKEAMRLAHSLKSNFATVGADDLRAVAAMLEDSCRNCQKEDAEDNLSILEEGTIQLKDALSKL